MRSDAETKACSINFKIYLHLVYFKIAFLTRNPFFFAKINTLLVLFTVYWAPSQNNWISTFFLAICFTKICTKT